MCGVRSYLNISELLPMLGRETKFVRENAAVGTSYSPLLSISGVWYYSIYCEFDRRVANFSGPFIFRHDTLTPR